MKPYNLLSLVFSLLIALPAFSQEKKEEHGKKYLTLYMGIQHSEVLSHLPPGSEFFGDYKSNVTAKLDRERKTLVFVPTKPGLSTMTVHGRRGEKLFEYRIDVRKSELTRVVREVRGLLTDVEGIQIKIINNKVVIDGTVLTPQDLNRIYGVRKQYGDKLVDSLVEINPIAQKKIAAVIEREINNPDIEVRAINGKFILKGIANSQNEKDMAEIIAKTYVPALVVDEAQKEGKIKVRKEQQVINLLSVRSQPSAPPEKIIQLVVHYVELSKKYLRSSAFQWAPALQDESSIEFTRDTRENNDGIVAQITGTISNLLPKLNSAKQAGFAKILKSTSVTTKENQKGSVQSNVRIPFLVRQPGAVAANTTQFVNVGVTSEITPKVVNPRNDIIELNMTFSVSDLLGNTDMGPQTAENRVQTVVNVRSGQSAAIGGLISNSTRTGFNPDANPDALFNLYSAKDHNRNKNQFVIFVTPIIKASASAGSENVKRKFRLRE